MTLEHWSREFLETTRGQVAAVLRRGPATVDEIASALELTPNAIRSHLNVLARDGIIRPGGVRRTDGVGKPATVYELAPGAEPIFSRAYLPVLEALLEAFTHLPPKTQRSVIRHAARHMATAASSDGTISIQRPVQRAASLLEGLGGLVEIIREEGRSVIQGHGCPVSALASDHPEVCRLVQTLLGEVTGMKVVEKCERGERSRCRFVLEERR